MAIEWLRWSRVGWSGVALHVGTPELCDGWSYRHCGLCVGWVVAEFRIWRSKTWEQSE